LSRKRYPCIVDIVHNANKKARGSTGFFVAYFLNSQSMNDRMAESSRQVARGKYKLKLPRFKVMSPGSLPIQVGNLGAKEMASPAAARNSPKIISGFPKLCIADQSLKSRTGQRVCPCL